MMSHKLTKVSQIANKLLKVPILGLPPNISVVHEGLGLRNVIYNLSVLVSKHMLSQVFLSPIRLIMPEQCVMI